jgi:uncharacterized protein (DUF1810 family)
MGSPQSMDSFAHFTAAQAPIYDTVIAELAAGRKVSHWMWFIFPQLTGLGQSAISQKFGIASLEAAKAYLAHPLLGARLRQCTMLVNAVEGATVHEIFGTPDDLKFHSSMTLFAHAAPDEPAFRAALVRYFGGEEDARTVAML